MDPIVQTTYGAVRGRSAGSHAVSKGIPYAAPLDGPRRFRSPEVPERWEGVREARSFSASVPQPRSPYPGVWSPGDDTECLTVNVWTPDPGGRGLPVMVWLHGGAFLLGTSAGASYDGAAYARSGVVFVSLNHRVGYEGFGWVADAPSNLGVLDQIAALRWVQENIVRFGGDPDRVTVFGQSAGASSVVTLAASAAAQGLLHRGIAQSVGGLFAGEDEARRIAEMITGALGVEPTAEALGTVPAEAIHAAQTTPLAAMAAEPAAWTQTFVPYTLVIDHEVLESPPWTAMRSGAGRAVDLISGSTADECRLFTADADPSDIDPGRAARDMRLPASAVDACRAAHPGIGAADLHALLLSDALFRMPSLWCAESHTAAGGRTYAYVFDWSSPVRDGALGACHSVDVPFTFGVTDDEIGRALLGTPVPPDFAGLSAELRTAWVSFADTGDPGWPEFRADRSLTRRWGTPATVVADPLAASRRIWRRRSGTP